MKRFIFWPFIILLLFASLTACGEEDIYEAENNFTPYSGTVARYSKLVYVAYHPDADVTIYGPSADAVSYTIEPGTSHISITSTSDSIAYFVFGTSDNGSLSINSSYDYALYLNALTLSSESGPLISSLGGANAHVVLCNKTTNYLYDMQATNYPSLGYSNPATFYVDGHVNLLGTGTLSIVNQIQPYYDSSLADSVYVHAFTAQHGFIDTYANTLTLYALRGDALHISDSIAYMQLGTFNFTAGRNGIYNGAGSIVLSESTLTGTAQEQFISAPSAGLYIDGGICMAASVWNSDVVFNGTNQYIYEQRMDTLTLIADSTYAAYDSTKLITSFTPLQNVEQPYLLLSSPSLTNGDNVRIVNK